jgi:hypothetical protein
VALDAETHISWLVQSLTGPFVLKPLEVYPVSKIKAKMRSGFTTGFEIGDPKRAVLALTERFIQDVVGDAPAPHHQIFVDSKWKTIVSAEEPTFEKFRQSVVSIKDGLPPHVLHETAVYGTGNAVRDLLRTHKIDIHRKCKTMYLPGEATALQVAFLRHNVDTVQALIDQGADILPLFSRESLEAFLVEGTRDYLHFLDHLIPLMKESKNQEHARRMFDTILLANRGLQLTIIQSNWSL